MILTGCSRQSKPADDYVLIEFASKLEEDYQKLLPPPVNEKKVDP
jgi:hypothetical protein